MRTLLKKLTVIVLFISLILPLSFSSSHVQAQRFSESNQVSNELIHVFDDLIMADRIQNPVFLEAYEDYKVAVDSFGLYDVGLEESFGTDLDEVTTNFVAGVEGELYTLSANESYLSYMYGVNEGTRAELLLYFVDEELYYIGLSNLQVDIRMPEFVSDATIQSWIDDKIPLSDLKDEEFRITGISQMVYSNQPYYMLMIPTGDTEDSLMIDYALLAFDELFQSFMLEFYFSLEAPQDNMISLFAYFFGATDEFPDDGTGSLNDGSQ